MICTHLRELYRLCETNNLRLGGSDLIRVVCRQCQLEETCPSVLMDDYEATHASDDAAPAPRTAEPAPDAQRRK